MSIEYNIVGIAKGEAKDMAELYDSIHLTVFAASLFILKDKKAAKNVAVETFRRVRSFAYSFDTDISGEFWITDMAISISKNLMLEDSGTRTEFVDNASALLTSAVRDLKNERGLMLALKAVSGLSTGDISDLSGFYSGSCRKEISRGKAELSEVSGGEIKPKNILAELNKAIEECCPDYFELIGSDSDTGVSHVSHERIYLDRFQANYGGKDEKETVDARESLRIADKKRRTVTVSIIVLSVLLVAGAILASVAAYNKKMNEPIPTEQPNVQFGNTVDFTEADGKIFYRGTNGGIYSYTPGDTSPVKISGESVRELVSDGKRLYFRSSNRSRLFSMEFDGSGVTQLYDFSGTTLTAGDGYLMFSTADGIVKADTSVLPGALNEPESVYFAEVEDAPSRNHIGVTSDGRIFFSGGADKGIYEVVPFADGTGLSPVYFDEAYYFQIDGDRLYYDVRLFDKISIYYLEISEKKTYSLPVYSYTAAYYIKDGFMYYEGVKFDADGNIINDSIGLYRLEIGSEEPELLFAIPADGLHISEIFAGKNNIYCYYSDGISGGERKIAVYDMNGKNEKVLR